VTFTKVFAIYHHWIHPLHPSSVAPHQILPLMPNIAKKKKKYNICEVFASIPRDFTM
jgi:hypothetical protein